MKGVTPAYREAIAAVKRAVRTSRAASGAGASKTSAIHPGPTPGCPHILQSVTHFVQQKAEFGKQCHCPKSRYRDSPLERAWMEEMKMDTKVAWHSASRILLTGNAFEKFHSDVQLLYCSRLLEQDDAFPADAEERLEIVPLGKQAIVTGEMPVLRRETRELLHRFASSAFFDKEPPFSSVLLERVGELRSRDRKKWDGLYNELVQIYTDRPAYRWRDWSMQTSLYEDSAREYDVFVNSVLDWKTCLEAMRSCPVLCEILTSRPPKSILPHTYAAMDCTEHVLLWMAKSELPVYPGLPIAYRDIHPTASPSPELMRDLSRRYKRDKMPAEMQNGMRFEYFLDSIGVPVLWTPEESIAGATNHLVEECGADRNRIPPASSRLLKPMEEATGPEKMKYWFPGSVGSVYCLHPALLCYAGYEIDYDFPESYSSDDED